MFIYASFSLAVKFTETEFKYDEDLIHEAFNLDQYAMDMQIFENEILANLDFDLFLKTTASDILNEYKGTPLQVRDMSN